MLINEGDVNHHLRLIFSTGHIILDDNYFNCAVINLGFICSCFTKRKDPFRKWEKERSESVAETNQACVPPGSAACSCSSLCFLCPSLK